MWKKVIVVILIGGLVTASYCEITGRQFRSRVEDFVTKIVRKTFTAANNNYVMLPSTVGTRYRIWHITWHGSAAKLLYMNDSGTQGEKIWGSVWSPFDADVALKCGLGYGMYAFVDGAGDLMMEYTTDDSIF